MLDVKIGSFICFAVYALQLFPKFLGKQYSTWYKNNLATVDEVVRWATNMFWGYVGIRVLNPGLYWGVLIYLFVLGTVRATFLYGRAKEKRLQEAISSSDLTPGKRGSHQISEIIKQPEKVVIKILSPIKPRISYETTDYGELGSHRTPRRISSIVYEIEMGRNVTIYYWLSGTFIPQLSKKTLDLEREEVKCLKNFLKKFEFSRALEELIPILEVHAARQ